MFAVVNRASIGADEERTIDEQHRHGCLDTGRRQQPDAELTSRQRQVLDLVAAGYTNAQIARRLGIAEGTVRKHLENIYRRLQVSSRTAAITRALPHSSWKLATTSFPSAEVHPVEPRKVPG